MILEHAVDPVSAKWVKDHWDIGEKTKYRWRTNITNQVQSQWFYDIQDALEWIIKYSKEA